MYTKGIISCGMVIGERMIRAMVGFFLVLSSFDAMEEYASISLGVVGVAIGLGLFIWPVATGYFKVAPEAHYARKNG